MSNLVIVAIPEKDDYIWKISSEKVPHMTLLFLGDVVGKPVLRIQEFLEHAVNILEIGPFGADVDYRGTLGEDEADVLFFRKDWSLRRIAEFRGQLLKDNNIKTAYDSVPDQYTEWTPHLTLGYPTTPAKKDTRDYPGTHWVQFDRIALWYGDYEGPEYQLTYNYDLAEVAMSTEAERGAEFIEHFGVKGMRWGVRTQREVSTTQRVDTGLTKRQTKIKTTGGEAHPAHEDAIKAAVQKQKLKKSGAAALSNQDLRELATRMQLEQQVSALAKGTRSAGAKFVDKELAKAQSDPFTTAKKAKRVGKAALLLAV